MTEQLRSSNTGWAENDEQFYQYKTDLILNLRITFLTIGPNIN